MEVLAVFISVLVVVFFGIVVVFSLFTSQATERPSPPHDGSGFLPSQLYLESGGQHGIAINESANTLCLFRADGSSPQYLPFSHVLGTGIIKNGTVLELCLRSAPPETATAAQQAHTQLIARLDPESVDTPSTERGSNSQAQKLDLCVLTHSPDDSLYIVNFLDMEAKEGGVIYEKALATARHWYHLLSDVIDQEDTQATSALQDNPSHQRAPLQREGVAQ